MAPVFAHGRLRLYLLKLLAEAPRHGYEVIRLLEERFEGLYAPSAGTVYPRLAKLEDEGLVTHSTEGGRKVYSLSEVGWTELAGRAGELAQLEKGIRDSVASLAAEIREEPWEARDAAASGNRPGYGDEWPSTSAPRRARQAADEHSDDPARDLERLLDRFRDDVRDAARDNGVSERQLREVRRHLSTAAAHVGAVLRPPRADDEKT